LPSALRDVRILCRWPEWTRLREPLLASGKIREAKLRDIALTTETDSLQFVERMISFEEAFGVQRSYPPKSPAARDARS
jgi:hypothetical protein